MSINKFSFQDEFRSWKLNNICFLDFNLLVGISGVGKTQILEALRAVRDAGLVDARNVNSCQWTIEATVGNDEYSWSAATSIGRTSAQTWLGVSRNGNELSEAEKPQFIREIITKNDVEIFKRDESGIIFKGNLLPKLKGSESVISLLGKEELIAPLYNFLEGILFSPAGDYRSGAYGIKAEMFHLAQVAPWLKQLTEIESLRHEMARLPLLLIGYILQKNFPDEYSRLEDDYREIFPTVQEIRIDRLVDMAPAIVSDLPVLLVDHFTLGLKEEGIEGWVLGGQISSGMMRTWMRLLEIAMAPAGAVILIDEFENSLGVNCLPQLTDHLLRRSDLQFILTSHHPYVINNIPWRYWKLVTRKGSEVTVRDAAEIPSLDTQSMLSRFVLLTNLDEYQEAIR